MDINIGERIKQLRTLKGLTVNKLANLAGVSQSYLRSIELGDTDNPSVDVLDCICTVLEISIKDFFDVEVSTSFSEDPLLAEIYQLTPKQKERLLAFLQSMKQ